MAPSAKLIILANSIKGLISEGLVTDMKDIAAEMKELEEKLDSIKKELCE